MTPPIPQDLKVLQRVQNQATSIRSVLQSVDRAISGQPDLDVEFSSRVSLAATDGETIYINRDKALDVFAANELSRALLIFKGTNYHELAHVLFSPREDDEIGKWISNNYRLKWAWNALEDQRIETLYTALYPLTTPYFRNSSYHWLLDPEQDNLSEDKFYRLYSLIGGRRYLDKSVRLKARAAFAEHYGAHVADELDEVVQAYVRLPLPAQDEEAKVLIERFHNLLKGEQIQGCGGTCGKTEALEEGEVNVDRVVEATQRVKEDQEKEEQEQAASAPGDAYPEDQNDDEEGSGSDGEESQDDGDTPEGGSKGTNEGDEGDEGEGNSDSEGFSDSSGTGNSSKGGSSAENAPEPTTADDLLDEVAEAQADVLADKSLQDDLERTAKAFRSQLSGKEETTKWEKYEEVPASSEALSAVRKVISQLKTLRTDLEPQWLRERTNGRVNANDYIRTVANHDGSADFFEQWDEGSEEEATTEVVILLDISASMGKDNAIAKCSEALWVLKKAFDTVGIKVTVLGFSNDNRLLYDADEKLCGTNLRSFHVWSSTRPANSLLLAHRILTKSTATNHVLITITDGIWSDVEVPEKVVGAIRTVGGHTLQFGVNGHSSVNDTHGHEHNVDITDISDIVKIVKDLVKNIQRKAALR